MTEIDNLLPVGSVVFLKDAIKKLMVIGIKPGNEEGKFFDYIGVMYPEGYINKDILFLFNHEDIVDIVYRGYENPEHTQFLQQIKVGMEKLNKK